MQIHFRARRIPETITLLAFTFLSVTLLINAWVVDDAYITFRTVDNFVNGYGLTWNPDERVQAYTHPLWMFVITIFHAITSEFFFTAIALSFALSLTSVLIGFKIVVNRPHDAWWKKPLLALSLIASKSFVDYASSGLENPLSYLLAAIFLYLYLPNERESQIDEGRIGRLLFLTALAFVNRMDTVILFIPMLLWLFHRALQQKTILHPARAILLPILPAVLWISFSLIYYGFPFPNTAYAKAISNGFPLLWKAYRGVEYQLNSIHWDTASYGMLGAAIWFALRKRSSAILAAIIGIALYMLYTLFSGAAATHMSGRFYAVPLFMAIIIFVKEITNLRFALLACGLTTAYIFWSPVSAVKFGTSAYQVYPQNNNYIDAKWYVYNEGAALLNWRPGLQMPNHVWFKWGESLRTNKQNVFVGGAGGEAIGYAAFAAGPHKHIIDTVGLSDPLLSRLPADIPPAIEEWKSGHFHRTVPEGYVESVETDSNMIRDPNLRAYYDVIRLITRGPLFNKERFEAIININLGKYDYLIANIE